MIELTEEREVSKVDQYSELTTQKNMVRDGDGRYVWVYEMPMLTAFFLLFEVWKVIGISGCIVFLLNVVITLVSGNGLGSIGGAFISTLIPLAILLVLSIPAYYIVTRANNGKYTVLFEMDEEGVDHTQIKTDKAVALEALTMLVGAATKNRSTIASGALSATGGSLYSRFSKVKKVRAYPEKHLIKLDGAFVSNQVYVENEYFDFVYRYILDHCPNASN